jgi:4-amino-4-deoxy-L-arabinose transferase-like glycosyltransferase
VKRRHLISLGAIVLGSAALLMVEGAVLPTAWLPVEEAAALQRARGGSAPTPSVGLLYPVLLSPAARWLSATAAYDFARALSAVLWAATAVPAYWLASRLVPPRAALAVAGLAVVIPASVYATAAVPDALALLLAGFALPLLSRASERGSPRDLAGALVLAAAAAAARPWLAVLPFALLVAYGIPRPSWRSLLRWPRSLGLAALAGVAYFTLASISSAAATAFTSPGATARGAVASVVVAAVGMGVVPLLLAVAGARMLPGRPETALFAVCLPALALASGVLAAADPRRGVDERPLLVLTPLVLALAAAAWSAGAARLRVAAVVGTLVVLAALALPTLGKAPVARAAGISVISADGGSRAFLVAGILAAVAVGLLMLRILRGRPSLLALALAVLLAAGQAAAWSSLRREADALAASEPLERGWIDRHAGPGARVVVAGRPETLGAVPVAQLTLWNRAVRGSQELDLSSVDPESGQWGLAPAAPVVLMQGDVEVSGTVLARSKVGVLLRAESPYRLAATTEGVYPDTWSAGRAIYRRFSNTPGVLHISVSRAGVIEDVPPAEVVIASGPLREDADEVRARFELRRGEKREAEVDVPEPGYRVVVTVTPTFQTADGRQVGAGLRFSYRARQ